MNSSMTFKKETNSWLYRVSSAVSDILSLMDKKGNRGGEHGEKASGTGLENHA